MCAFSTIITWLAIVLFYCHSHCAGEPPEYARSNLPESSHSETQLVHNASSASKTALLAIFAKYGQNGSLSFEGFEHLLTSLGLGNIAVSDHNVSEHRESKGTWSVTLATDDLHPHSDHHVHSDDHHHHHDDHHHDDELDVENNDIEHKEHAENLSDECTGCLSSVVNSLFFFLTAVINCKQVNHFQHTTQTTFIQHRDVAVLCLELSP